jgi:2-oxoglutarate ferredoxin oxidoreductase subunit delta
MAAVTSEEIERPRSSLDKRGRRKKRARVTVFANWCKGCGLCVAFCPQQVFEEDDESHPIVAHPERCTGCGWCTMHCPDFAIFSVLEDEPESGCDPAESAMKASTRSGELRDGDGDE